MVNGQEKCERASTEHLRFVFCIVTHNSSDCIESALGSIAERVGPTDAIIVVDNGSTDGTRDVVRAKAPNVTLIEQKNVGFGRGNNEAWRRVSCKYFVLMNPDVEVLSLNLDRVDAYFDANGGVVSLVGDVRNPDGTRQYVNKRFPTVEVLFLRRFPIELLTRMPLLRHRLQRYELRDKVYEEPFRVPVGTGSFQIVRRGSVREAALFDPRFFMYFEDTDLARRLNDVGETRYVPWIKIRHGWKRESHRSFGLALVHVVSLVKYFAKWGFGMPNE